MVGIGNISILFGRPYVNRGRRPNSIIIMSVRQSYRYIPVGGSLTWLWVDVDVVKGLLIGQLINQHKFFGPREIFSVIHP